MGAQEVGFNITNSENEDLDRWPEQLRQMLCDQWGANVRDTTQLTVRDKLGCQQHHALSVCWCERIIWVPT
ncbi:hypothetical protein SAMN05421858_4982 [Haladaptatus litoreus]|uniref:Uncharacterized protein n=1 Tax=Haladaptatus litoreus TaxID=553468 RepID=A0A1N7FDP6_9EURY|nr:hypothetical protein [Haladaptatus litoreus]SIR98479.1 hypothetical protein SAMN05421858_4982 [Haladaptatus litoreus]